MHLDVYGYGIKVGTVKLVDGKLITNVFKCPYDKVTEQDKIDYPEVIKETVEDKYYILRNSPSTLGEDISAKDHPEEIFNKLHFLCRCSYIQFSKPIEDKEDKPKVKGIIEKAIPEGMRPESKIKGRVGKSMNNNKKVKGIIEKCIHPRIEVDIEKLDLPKLGVGMGANIIAKPIVGKINAVYDKTFNAQKSKDKLKEEVDVKKVVPALAIAGGKALGISVGTGAANKIVGEGLEEGWNAAAGNAPTPPAPAAPAAKSLDNKNIKNKIKPDIKKKGGEGEDPGAALAQQAAANASTAANAQSQQVTQAVGQQNQALTQQSEMQMEKPGASNSPLPVQKDINKYEELFPGEEIEVGMREEGEHSDVTNGDPELTRKIVDAHLKEDPHYYSKLMQVGLIKKDIDSSAVDEEFYTKIGRGKENKINYDNMDKIKENNKIENSEHLEKYDDPKEVKHRLLGNIQHFLEKYEEDNITNKEEQKQELLDIKNAIAKLNVDEDGNIWSDEDSNYGGGKETENDFRKRHNLPKLPDINNPNIKEDDKEVIKDINMFLKGYESLAYLGNDLGDERLFDIFTKAVQVNESKDLGIKMNNEDRIAKIIAIDGVAHALHMNKNKDGSSQYIILDELADVSKSFGEKERSTRLIIMNNPNTAKDIEKLLKLEILQKSGLERSSKFWKLLEKAIKIGVQKLSNFELVALREFLYAKL